MMNQPSASGLPVSTPSRGTILLVDDEAEIITALADLFEDEYDVLSTTSPTEALAMLRRSPEVSVILSDQRMPGMTGDQMLAAARAHTRAEALLLTGYADLDAVVSALNKGRIAGYSPKPWDPVALRGMVGGAHERWQLARALEVERSLLHGLLDHSPDRISFKDAKGRFVRLNAAKARSLGVDAEAGLGQREDAFVPQDSERHDAERAVTLSGLPAAEIREEGSRTWSVRRVPILRDGKVRFVATVEQDVTEQREMETRLRQADKMQALGTMAGGVAHDFNNLLTAVIGNLQLAGRHVPAEQERLQRYLRNAMASAERGASLTHRLLSFSRQRELDMQVVDVNLLLLGLEDLLARSLGSIVRVEMRLATENWSSRIDAGQLELAVLNLCINARDAMPEGGTILLGSCNIVVADDEVPGAAAGEYVVVSVQDQGQGMSPEVLARVFEPFFTTKEVGRGTGLGLSMVYGLMQQVGGTVHALSTEGHGTTVELFLPRAAPALPGIQESSPEGADLSAAAKGRKILVVDDDNEVRGVTCSFLADMGCEVLEAATGQEGLALIRDHPDLAMLIADFAMPGMLGSDLAQEAQDLRPKLPILLVTGFAELGSVPAFCEVLHKPFRKEVLAGRMSGMLCS